MFIATGSELLPSSVGVKYSMKLQYFAHDGAKGKKPTLSSINIPSLRDSDTRYSRKR